MEGVALKFSQFEDGCVGKRAAGAAPDYILPDHVTRLVMGIERDKIGIGAWGD
jgi:hypothetical protein